MDAIRYAVKKDVHNTVIVREVDRLRQRDLWRWVVAGLVLVGLLLLNAVGPAQLYVQGYRIEQLKQQLAAEEATSRQLQLQIETLRDPRRIEGVALTELHLVAPGPEDRIVLQRVVASEPPPSTVVARRGEDERGQ